VSVGIGDKEKAIKWNLRAAQMGLSRAQYWLAEQYSGMTLHRTRDEKWTLIPISEKYAVVKRRWMSDSGWTDVSPDDALAGLPHDLSSSRKWFESASVSGVLSGERKEVARLRVGLMYTRGEGVSQDKVEGCRWFLLASDIARHEAEEIKAALSASELARAEGLAEEWRRLSTGEANRIEAQLFASGRKAYKSMVLPTKLESWRKTWRGEP